MNIICSQVEFNQTMVEDSIGRMNGAPDADIVVFTEALRLPPEERDRYLDKACKSDVEFRRRVEALIQAYEQAGDFLGRPAAERFPAIFSGIIGGEGGACRPPNRGR